jgi:RNA polymerase sigma-70 factor (ECF subfamily)
MMQRVVAGDQAAFAEVFQRTSPKLFGLCLRILPTRGDAEEALQEAYLAIWRRAATFDPSRGAVWPWLFTVTRHCAIDRLRASRPVVQTPLDEAEPIADPLPLASDMLLDREREQQLAACLEQLEPRDLLLIRAAFLEGESYPALARRTAAPLGTVKSRIRRALIRLRDCL